MTPDPLRAPGTDDEPLPRAPARHGEWRPALHPMGDESVELVDDDGCSLWVEMWEVAALVNGAVDRAAGVRVAPSPDACRHGTPEGQSCDACESFLRTLHAEGPEAAMKADAPSPDAPGLREALPPRPMAWYRAVDGDALLYGYLLSPAEAAALAIPPRDALDDHHTPNTTCPVCRYAQDHLALPLDEDRLARALVQTGLYIDAMDPLAGIEDPPHLAATLAREYARLSEGEA